MTTRSKIAAGRIVDMFYNYLVTEWQENDLARVMRQAHQTQLEADIAKRIEQEFGACAANADDSEPIFVLRAQDKSAPAAVRMWSSIADRDCAATEKVKSAREIERQMAEWQAANASRVKAAD